MPDRSTLLKAAVGLTVATVGIVMLWGDMVAVGIGVFLLINAFLMLGSLVWV